MDKLTNNHPIVTEIQSRLTRLTTTGRTVKFCWVPGHVDIHGNDEADRLAREAAQSNGIIERPMVPHTDYYPSIRMKLYEQWQAEWLNIPESNKLRSYRDTIKIWPSSQQKLRKNEVILSRLRIGHTRLTHGYLMRGEHLPPYCDSCVVPLTIKHILVECPDHDNMRQGLFGPNPNMKTILSDPMNGHFNIQPVITYLTTLGYINEI